jgi:hypothetical protein
VPTHDRKTDRRCLLLAHVAVGEYTKVGPKELPPRKPGRGATPYETLVDNLKAPTVYVTTHDGQALPLYVVLYGDLPAPPAPTPVAGSARAASPPPCVVM